MTWATPTLATLVAVMLPGCSTLHTNLDQAAIDHQINKQFGLGMDRKETKAGIRKIGLRPVNFVSKLSAFVYPEHRPIFLENPEFVRVLQFEFTNEGGLEKVYYYPDNYDYMVERDMPPHIIKLHENEDDS